ncbi:MAG: DUF4394 domain-containing protein [Drouetiella hepatica Uher 2000/2452]|jgi:hypothetical protein|uniref:DUF4394 domain-containing protein n=1 Tax=Drouetiella hepatica Uher 2000/2452 TaxID=904376 RepID=A0A951UNB6_9CYAN|nr:DUF4394 domain-containing protein [Drouetiella hepatica Uher 2000/2452]
MTGTAYVFIDRNTYDYQYLIDHVKPGYQVILLENDRDGIDQVTEVLQNSREVTELHLVSHGSPGCLYLGNTHLSLENLDRYAGLLKQWRTALAHQTNQCADLMLYGCRVAEQGWSEFSRALSTLTGANIAASRDEVGNGRWNLDQRQGAVAADLAFSPQVQQAYQGVFSVGYALSNNSLIAFDTLNPDNPGAAIAVTGLGTGENLVGIDVRPQNGKLYGLTSNGSAVRLYVISPQTGVATALTTVPVQFDDGAGNAVPITSTNFGLDFNPTVDRLRVVTDSGLNFRMNPNTGALVDGNTVTLGVNADAGINGGGAVDAAAYTNSAPNVTTTTQYTLSAASDTLSIQNPPNNGTQTLPLTVTLGGTRLDFTAVSGFDIPAGVNVATSNIPAAGNALAALTVGGSTGLYSIELSTGAATRVGAIGTGTAPAQGFAVQNEASVGDTPLIGLTAANAIVRFNRSSPSTAITVPITGLAAGESVVGIDFRPATGQLFALSTNGAGGVRLSIIDPQTGAATAVTTTFQQFDDGAGNAVPIQATAFGIDFNPTVDRIRVVTNTGQNFRLNPITGLLVDGDNGGAVGSAVGTNPDGSVKGSATAVDATAYTNSFAGATVTTQYTLDATTDRLLIQNPPNSGTQSLPLAVTLNGAPLDFSAVNGFDIPAGVRVATANAAASGRALAALTVGGSSNLYAIELSTGAATLLGAVGAGTTQLIGLAAADSPVGAVAFATPTYSVNENGTSIGISLVRTGGSTGAFTVNLSATGGTATTADYSGLPGTITFADGQTTATATLNITRDTLVEVNETLNLSLSSPTNGAVLAVQDAAVLTINEPLRTLRGNGASGTTRGTITNDRLLGLGGNDALLGFGGNDVLDGGSGGDRLNGGLGADLYVYAGRTKQAAFANSLIGALDRVLGFKVSEGDRFQLDFDNRASTINLPRRLFNAGQEGNTLTDAVRTAYADKDQQTRGRQGLGVNEAVFFTSRGQTYLSVNDGQAGFSASRDLLINVTGIGFNPGDATAGTLTVSNYFA